jgi:hypothetical protein
VTSAKTVVVTLPPLLLAGEKKITRQQKTSLLWKFVMECGQLALTPPRVKEARRVYSYSGVDLYKSLSST